VSKRRPAGLALLALALAACSDEGNFSQYPGFAAWYAANPPAETVPDTAGQALLARFAPRVFLPEGHEGPIDFYRDYIAQGRLRAGDQVIVEVSQETLNRHKGDPAVVFEHTPADLPVHPVMYGRIDRAQLFGCAAPLTFLTYHLVFRHSGLPAALPWWQSAALGLVGDLDDWHQLDHYTAVSLALMPDASGDLAPFAATFQHHNYMRSYLLGAGDGPGRLALPADGRLEVDVAIRSNELYPHRQGRVQRRAVSFMSPDSAVYLVTGKDPPWRAADDVTEPAREIDPDLMFLPPADAFYVFQGWLGERRVLPGRDGPPGADYNTRPALKDKALQLAAFYWYEDDADYLELLAGTEGGRPRQTQIGPYAERLARDSGAGSTLAGCAGRRIV
jgi:hypothetical protein